MSSQFEWSLQDSDGLTSVRLKGAITEEAALTKLEQDLKNRPHVRLDLQEVARINSWGVREWIRFMRSFRPECRVELARCSPAIVAQLNTVKNFAGPAKTVSVSAPFVCTGCGCEQLVVFEMAECIHPRLDGRQCPQCGAPLEFDDVPISFFAFARSSAGT